MVVRNFARLLILFLIYSLISCQHSTYEENSWEVYLNGVGSSSSAKATDLNKDGILDIIIGAGGREFNTTPMGVIALDGNSGQMLWKVKTRNQIVGTPLIRELTKDSINDILIGGRSAELMLIDGRSGELVWEYNPFDASVDLINDTTMLNFFNPQFCPDIDGDGEEDVLISFGGFVKAKPEEKNRPQGYLLGISSKTGQEIIRMGSPDGKEMYLSPLLVDFKDGNGLQIIFGTGGETIGGGLYTLAFADYKNQQFQNFNLLLKDSSKGYIAPPAISDINHDGIPDIVVNAVNGEISCVNGKTKSLLWTTHIGEGFEGYAMPCLGDFTKDGTSDVFSTYGYGAWPETEYTVNVLLDGTTGDIVYRDSVGTFQYASPVSYDFTGDGRQDVLLAVNTTLMSKLGNSKIESKFLANELFIYDFAVGRNQKLRPTKIGSNLGTTPLICDLDGDGYLDVINCYMSDSKNFYSFSNMMIERIEVKVKVGDPFNWNSYMGVNSNGLDISVK